MNLCGGITSISEQDLVLQLPAEEFHLTSRRRKPSSTPDRRSNDYKTEGNSSSFAGKSRSSSRGREQNLSANARSMVQDRSSPMLNPVSQDDMAKMRSRQRSHPLRGMKYSSILMKKLESGFNVVSDFDISVRRVESLRVSGSYV